MERKALFVIDLPPIQVPEMAIDVIFIRFPYSSIAQSLKIMIIMLFIPFHRLVTQLLNHHDAYENNIKSF